jgi:CheY-like chemotaxis protein
MTISATASERFKGRRALVVEDEMLVFMLIESVLADLGLEVLPPAGRLHHALEAARSAEMDVALLDVNLAGEMVFPVAEILAQRAIPFIFLTGYGESILQEPFTDRPVIQKPFRDGALIRAIEHCLPPIGAETL